MNSEPMTLITATRVPSRRGDDREPLARRGGREVRRTDDAVGAGEVRARSRIRRHVWLPSVIASTPAASSRSASFGVMPTPSATFSPFAMQKSTSSSSRSDGRRSSTALRARGADDVGDEENPQLAESARVARTDLDARRGSRRRSCTARATAARRRSGRSPSRARVCDAVTVAPTDSDSSAETCVSETTTDGARAGWMSIRSPYGGRRATYGVTPTTRAVDRRVDGGARRARRRRRRSCAGPAPPPIWYQAGPWPPPPKSLWPSRASSPSFAWRPTGSSASAPSPAPWKPIAVTRLGGIGSCRRRSPSFAITTAAAGSRAGSSRCAGAGAIDETRVRGRAVERRQRERHDAHDRDDRQQREAAKPVLVPARAAAPRAARRSRVRGYAASLPSPAAASAGP